MNLPKIMILSSITLFSAIAILGLVKRNQQTKPMVETPVVAAVEEKPSLAKQEETVVREVKVQENKNEPLVDRIEEFFMLGPNKLPIVETITYTSRVSWLKGRPAWIADYAAYFKTSRHFIARSLNRKADYLTQKVSPGDRFNVLRSDMRFEFNLKIDVSRCTMDFYYHDLDKNEKVLLKTYKVSLGNRDEYADSGTLTPLGKYYLGDKIATYKPGVMGFFQNERVEMINVFGSRWLPFKGMNEEEDAKINGYGIHGVPMVYDAATGQLHEENSCIEKYSSMGCIRLKKEDIEELYAIVVTRPTTVEIVKGSNQD